LRQLQDSLAHRAQLLATLSYRAVLARGFALVRNTGGTPLHSASAVGPGSLLEIEFADGRITATAQGGPGGPPTGTETPIAVKKPKRATKRVLKSIDQGSLF